MPGLKSITLELDCIGLNCNSTAYYSCSTNHGRVSKSMRPYPTAAPTPETAPLHLPCSSKHHSALRCTDTAIRLFANKGECPQQKHDLGPQGGEAVQGLHRMFLCSCARMNAGSAVCSPMQTLGECCGQSLEGIVVCLAFNILGQNALRRVNREARRLSVIFPW